MIKLHKLNGSEFVVNSHHIETIEANPDTVITLTNEHKYIVKEKPDTVVEMIVEYNRRIYIESGRV